MAQQIKKKFIKNDAVDGSKIKLLEGQSLRIETVAGEVELLKLGVNGEVMSKGQELAFKQSVDTLRSELEQAVQDEETARIAGDEDLQDQITQEVADRQLGDTQTLSAAIEHSNTQDTATRMYIDNVKEDLEAADATLQGNIDAEESARIAGDAETLTSAQGYTDTARQQIIQLTMSEIEDARAAARSYTNSEVSKLKTEVNTADATLQANINAEATARIAGDAKVLNDAETYVDSEISSLSSAMVTRDNQLQSSINTEKSRIDAILSASQADKDSFAEIVTLINSVDTENDQAFASYVLSNNAALAQEILDRESGDLEALNSAKAYTDQEVLEEKTLREAAISAEEAARIAGDAETLSEANEYADIRHMEAVTFIGRLRVEVEDADSALSRRINTEVSDRQAADSVLDGKITTEKSQREAADAALQSSINTEMSRAMSVESSLQSQITQEISDRQAADTVLQGNIDSEESAREAADLVLQGNIDAEEARAMGVESDLQSQITSEISRATTAEGVLQGNIDAEEARAMAAESSLDSRIVPIEDLLDFEKAVIFENNAAVVADGQPGVQDASLRDGWYYENKASGQKINWYFFDGVNQANIQKQDFSAYAVVTFDSVASLPILAVYTTPTGSNDVIPGFAHSRYIYSNFSQTPVVGKKYLIHIGDAPAIHPELPRIKVNETSSQGEKLPTERVFTSSFGSNSGAQVGKVKMVVEHLGVSSDNFKANAELRIRPASFSSLETEKSERISGDAALNSRLLVLESDPVTKTYVDGQVSGLQSQINNVLSNVDPAALDSLTEVVSAFQSADSDLQSAIAALGTGSSSALAQEILDRQAGDAALQASLEQEIQDRMLADSGLQGSISTIANDLSVEISDRQAAVSTLYSALGTEEMARMSADENLQGNIEAEMDRAMAVESSLQSQIDSEVSRAQSAEQALDARLDVLEAKTFGKQKIVVSTELSYVELEREVVANSLVVFVNRLGAHKDEDYTVSVVGGKTRLTWINSFANPSGQEAIESGDEVFVTFYY